MTNVDLGLIFIYWHYMKKANAVSGIRTHAQKSETEATPPDEKWAKRTFMQCPSQAVVCISTPRMYLRSRYFLVK